MNVKKNIVSMLVLATLIMTNCIISSAAVTTKNTSYSSYSAVGLRVCYIKFTAEGDTKKHTISNYYKSAGSTALLNSVENETKWKSNYGKYKKANYTADHKVGVPTPWGTVGYTHKSVYLSLQF